MSACWDYKDSFRQKFCKQEWAEEAGDLSEEAVSHSITERARQQFGSMGQDQCNLAIAKAPVGLIRSVGISMWHLNTKHWRPCKPELKAMYSVTVAWTHTVILTLRAGRQTDACLKFGYSFPYSPAIALKLPKYDTAYICTVLSMLRRIRTHRRNCVNVPHRQQEVLPLLVMGVTQSPMCTLYHLASASLKRHGCSVTPLQRAAGWLQCATLCHPA